MAVVVGVVVAVWRCGGGDGTVAVLWWQRGGVTVAL